VARYAGLARPGRDGAACDVRAKAAVGRITSGARRDFARRCT
jgi:hypothetical protein